MKNIEHLVRSNIRHMHAYSSARSLYTLGTLLDANENPYNLFQTKDAVALNRYPDGDNPQLRKKLASIFEVPVNMVSVGNGSDELIDLLVRIFCEPRIDEICICVPTFGMYRVAADMNDVKVIEVPLKNYDLDEEAVLKACSTKTKILFLCNPNNPTGTILSHTKLLNLLAKLECIVVIDEAYAEFSPGISLVSELEAYPNLVILKTLSKAYAMAGARLGIGLASEEISTLLKKVKMPYNISIPASHAVLEALEEHEKIYPIIKELLERRKNLEAGLHKLSMVHKILDSHTNFLCVKFSNASLVFKSLLEKNIILRKLSGPWLEGFIRISVGTENENQELLDALYLINKDLANNDLVNKDLFNKDLFDKDLLDKDQFNKDLLDKDLLKKETKAKS